VQILIADGEAAHVFLLEMFLRKWGYEVISTDDGNEAWRIFQRDDCPRMAILEWHLAGMDGIEICRRAKQLAGRSKHILLLTARAQQKDILLGLSAGADDYMAKPYDPGELRARLATASHTLQSRS
jgi:DNA-binding response OmpR family regulator